MCKNGDIGAINSMMSTFTQESFLKKLRLLYVL